MVFFASELVSRLCQPQLSEVFTRESAAQQFQTVAIKYEKSIISVGKAFLFYCETSQTENSERIVWFGGPSEAGKLAMICCSVKIAWNFNILT